MQHTPIRAATLTTSLAVVAALGLSAVAGAVTYPGPGNPGTPTPRKGGAATLYVCKKSTKKKTCFKTIQRAITAAQSGDRIRVADGVYKEEVKIEGAKLAGIRLTGNVKNPAKVVIDSRLKPKKKGQNGVLINGANDVTVEGFTARNYAANGFFAVNDDGYTLQHLRAEGTGTYGLYAFNSVGGTMQDSVAFHNNDSGFYVGQTKPQTKPKRTILRRLKSYENVLGYSGTNSRYVTITDSDWFNNAVGIVPNVLDSEKYPPNASNVISGNRVFWNNFDYYKGAPFPLRKTAAGEIPFPVGVGILLFGGHDNKISGNQVFGNYLVGVGLIQQIENVAFDPSKCTKIKCEADPTKLINNVVSGNQYGKSGNDLNGRDAAYTGNGSGNCFANETYLSPTLPADKHTFVACGQPDVDDPAVLQEALNWTVNDPTHEAYWVKHPHQPITGITPLETFTKP
jgi:hypothetical protein